MRKDAKIGFAIGGVLLAVLAVYAIVVPKKTNLKPAGVTLVTPPAPSHGAQEAPPGSVIINGVTVPAAPIAAESNEAKSSDPIASAGDAAKTSDGVNWAKLLSGNADAPTLMTTTPSPDAKDATPPAKEGSDAKAAPAPTGDAPAHEKVAAADPAPEALPLLAEGRTAKPATQPGRSYTIKPGQTLSSIAAEVYGRRTRR